MNKNLITFENKIIKVLLRNVYKKIDVEITYQFANPYQLITCLLYTSDAADEE